MAKIIKYSACSFVSTDQVEMNHLLITLVLYILGPQLASARSFLVVDVDALKELDLDQDTSNVARRLTNNKHKVDKTKALLRKIFKKFQSYDEHQLQFVFEYARKKLTNMEGNSKSKQFILNKLGLMRGKSGKQIKQLMGLINGVLATKTFDKDLGAASGIIEKLWAEYEKNFGARKSAQDPDVLDTIKSALEKVVGLGQVYNDLNKIADNPLMKFAQLLMAPEVNAEDNDDRVIENVKRHKAKPISPKTLSVNLPIFNDRNGPSVKGQLDIKLVGAGADDGLKLKFNKK